MKNLSHFTLVTQAKSHKIRIRLKGFLKEPVFFDRLLYLITKLEDNLPLLWYFSSEVAIPTGLFSLSQWPFYFPHHWKYSILNYNVTAVIHKPCCLIFLSQSTLVLCSLNVIVTVTLCLSSSPHTPHLLYSFVLQCASIVSFISLIHYYQLLDSRSSYSYLLSSSRTLLLIRCSILLKESLKFFSAFRDAQNCCFVYFLKCSKWSRIYWITLCDYQSIM